MQSSALARALRACVCVCVRPAPAPAARVARPPALPLEQRRQLAHALRPLAVAGNDESRLGRAVARVPARTHATASSASTTASSASPSSAQRSAERVTWLGVAADCVLSVSKVVVGIASRSTALTADGFHGVADIVADLATLWAVRVAHMPRDENHPYGHGRFETLGTLGVGALLMGTGVFLGREAVETLLAMHAHAGELAAPALSPTMHAALATVVGSIVLKEALYRVTMRVARTYDSPVMEASALHHRSDALLSLLTLVGVGGALAGWPVLDPLVGLAVSGVLLKSGLDIVVRASRELTDEQVEPELAAQIRDVVLDVRGVQGVERVRTRNMGSFRAADISILVASSLTVGSAAAIVDSTRAAVLRAQPKIVDVVVHLGGAVCPASCSHHTALRAAPDAAAAGTTGDADAEAAAAAAATPASHVQPVRMGADDALPVEERVAAAAHSFDPTLRIAHLSQVSTCAGGVCRTRIDVVRARAAPGADEFSVSELERRASALAEHLVHDARVLDSVCVSTVLARARRAAAAGGSAADACE